METTTVTASAMDFRSRYKAIRDRAFGRSKSPVEKPTLVAEETRQEALHEFEEESTIAEVLDEQAKLMAEEMRKAQEEAEVEAHEEGIFDGNGKDIVRDASPTAKAVEQTPDEQLQKLDKQAVRYQQLLLSATELLEAIPETMGTGGVEKAQEYLRMSIREMQAGWAACVKRRDEIKLDLIDKNETVHQKGPLQASNGVSEEVRKEQSKADKTMPKETPGPINKEQIKAEMAEQLRHEKEKAKVEASKEEIVDKSLEHQIRFNAWPTLQKRAHTSEIRRARLTNLSIRWKYHDMIPLIFGGRIEKLQYTPGDGQAWVQFLLAEGCKKFYDGTPNGIVVPGEARVVEVELDQEGMSTNEWVRSQIEYGVTRCVRVVGIDQDIGIGNLNAVAADKKRKVERLINGTSPSNRRSVEFRFLSIEDAFNFKSEMQKDEDFEHCTFNFAKDPCDTDKPIRGNTK